MFKSRPHLPLTLSITVCCILATKVHGQSSMPVHEAVNQHATVNHIQDHPFQEHHLLGEHLPDDFPAQSSWLPLSQSMKRFYGRADAVFYKRSRDRSSQPIILNSTGLVIVTADDLDFDYEPASRVLVGISSCDNVSSYEFEYLGNLNWSSSGIASGLNSLMLEGDLGSGFVNGFVNSDEIRIDQSTDFYSLEANHLRCICDNNCRRFEFLGGLRYVSLDDGLKILSNNVPAQVNSLYTVNTRNQLYGFQLGGRVRDTSSKLGWELIAKAGVYLNEARQEQSIVDQLPSNPVVLRNTRASNRDVAFLGELGFSVFYQISEAFAVRGGYNSIWIEGVALAPDQLDFSAGAMSGSTLDDGRSFLAHGWQVGAEFNW